MAGRGWKGDGTEVLLEKIEEREVEVGGSRSPDRGEWKEGVKQGKTRRSNA